MKSISPVESGESDSSKPLFKSTAFGRLLTRRNLILIAAIVIVADIVLTRYFFTSRYRALFLNRIAVAAGERGGDPVRLGDLTPFAWTRAEVARRENGGARFWFSTYGSRTYVFDYIFDYTPGELEAAIPAGFPPCLPDSEFVLERGVSGVHMRPFRGTESEQ